MGLKVFFSGTLHQPSHRASTSRRGVALAGKQPGGSPQPPYQVTGLLGAQPLRQRESYHFPTAAAALVRSRRGFWRAYSHCRTLALSKIHAPRVHTFPTQQPLGSVAPPQQRSTTACGWSISARVSQAGRSMARWVKPVCSVVPILLPSARVHMHGLFCCLESSRRTAVGGQPSLVADYHKMRAHPPIELGQQLSAGGLARSCRAHAWLSLDQEPLTFTSLKG